MLAKGQKDESTLLSRLPMEIITKIARHSLDGDPVLEEIEERDTKSHEFWVFIILVCFLMVYMSLSCLIYALFRPVGRIRKFFQ
jgi:hypothetical protein